MATNDTNLHGYKKILGVTHLKYLKSLIVIFYKK